MQGYSWARTADNELFVVLVVGGKGYVPGVKGAIELAEISLLEPVQWPTATTLLNRNSHPPKFGARAAGATAECVILPFAANG